MRGVGQADQREVDETVLAPRRRVVLSPKNDPMRTARRERLPKRYLRLRLRGDSIVLADEIALERICRR